MYVITHSAITQEFSKREVKNITYFAPDYTFHRFCRMADKTRIDYAIIVRG